MYFSDSPQHVVQAYVNSGEGLDRAGGFAIQVRRCGSKFSVDVTHIDIMSGIGRTPDPENRRRFLQCRWFSGSIVFYPFGPLGR